MSLKAHFNQRRSIFRARYKDNKVLQLIIACAVLYIFLKAMEVILLVVTSGAGHSNSSIFTNIILPYIGLRDVHEFLFKPWTLVTYFWVNNSFFMLLADMLWLYCFGSVIQTFVGYREIFPMFILSALTTGISFLIISYIWPSLGQGYLLTTMPGVMAFAIGAFALMPDYRYFLTERFSIPIWVVLGIFLVLNVLTMINSSTLMVLYGLAGLSGFLYIYLLRLGYRPGTFFYEKANKMQAAFTPEDIPSEQYAIKRKKTLDNSQHQVYENPSEEYIDFLLDKINQQGYKSLTVEEKQSLKNAGEQHEVEPS